ncbi:MAG: OsmC family protein [Salinivirgaceae bacterium]|jgi:putative redox protein|nr:OsmC family protein [Salinivirgaceae bacterium]
MKKKINMSWKGGMAFETELDGHKLIVDAPEQAGGNDLGPRPKVLMLTALGGCTGMDVVSLLKKMRVEIDDLNIRIEANMTEEHPKQFDDMKIIYELSGNDIDEAKVKKAIAMSMEKYCGVSAVYRKAMPVDYEIVIK